MLLGEILRMAFGSIGVNKLRSILTMAGITIGVFTVVGVMTMVSALRGSIETGLSFLGTNMFQFGKWPTGLSSGGADRHKYEIRRNITLQQAQRYQHLMDGIADVICLKVFAQDGDSEAVYENRKTTPGITFGGSNEYFLAANQYDVETGRNFTGGDVDLARPIAIIGTDIVKKLFPSESPLGKQIKVSGRTYTVTGTFKEKGTSFGQSQDNIIMVPITRFLQDFGANKFTVNIATQAPSQTVYNETIDKAITAMRIVRELKDKAGTIALGGGAGTPVAATGASADAVSALGNLGFKPAEAAAAVKAAEDELGADATLDALVRLALRKASK